MIEQDQKKKSDKLKIKGHIKYVYKQMGKAIVDYRMLNKDDMLLVSVSGSQGCIALIKLLAIRKQRVPVNFDFKVCLIDSDFIKFDKNKLKDYCDKLKVDLIVRKINPKENRSDCFMCLFNRRKAVFDLASELKTEKVVLTQDMDDITQATVMNMLFFGQIRTLSPKIVLKQKSIEVIRPLAYLTKEAIFRFNEILQLPKFRYLCDHRNNFRREKAKEIIEDLEKDCPVVKKNIFNAMNKIKKDYLV